MSRRPAVRPVTSSDSCPRTPLLFTPTNRECSSFRHYPRRGKRGPTNDSPALGPLTPTLLWVRLASVHRVIVDRGLSPYHPCLRSYGQAVIAACKARDPVAVQAACREMAAAASALAVGSYCWDLPPKRDPRGRPVFA